MANFIENYFEVTPDPRSSKSYLMGSPFQITLVLTIYVCFVKKWGPLYMKDRKPFDLKRVLIVYNVLQILINGYVVYLATPLILFHSEWNNRCFKVSESNPGIAKLYMRLSYTLSMIKIVDLFDTVFFVLRKRYKQVSFTHFLHHLIICSEACLVFRYVPNGHLGMIGYTNSIVLTVMYSYYLLLTISSKFKELIWFKKCVTIFQIVQSLYVSLFIHFPWRKAENCGYPFKLLPLTLFHNYITLYLLNPRSADYFLIGSPIKTTVIVALYAYFVKVLGPKLMKNRAPYELRTIIQLYNIAQIFFNGYFVIMAFPLLFHSKFIGRCFSLDEIDYQTEKMILFLTYLYCMVKILDLMDTIFFVLRKRYKQVSFLHFYHHLLVAFFSPLVFRYVPNGHMNVPGYINSIIHTVMYFYYFMSNLKPDMKHSIWWKKYITLMQIMQFVFLTGYFIYPLSNGEFCGYPFKFLYFAFAQNLLFLLMFSNFYYKTYCKKTNEKKSKL